MKKSLKMVSNKMIKLVLKKCPKNFRKKFKNIKKRDVLKILALHGGPEG